MIRGALLFAIGALALAALASSYLPDPAAAPVARARAPSPAAAAPAEDVPAKAAERQTAAFRETSIEADARGQYAADAFVNGLPVRMLIDTGASFVAISASTAARLGLSPGPGPKWRIKTANGELTASPVMLSSVSFGGLYMTDVQALVLEPGAGEANLLGASFLKRLVSVEQRDGIMILRQ